MSRILIVDDDDILNRGICFAIEKEGYNTISALNYNEAVEVLDKYDDILIAIIDINLPQKSGIDLCRFIRKKSYLPVIFLTAKDTEEDIIQGFKFGCDDYISKPFSVAVLIERINAVLRRSKGMNNNIYVYEKHGIKINFDKMEVYKYNTKIKVSPKEFKLLQLLCENRGKVMKREVILEKLWDIDGEFIDSNSLSVTIKRLREKIEDDSKNPKYIITVFGIGYSWGLE